MVPPGHPPGLPHPLRGEPTLGTGPRAGQLSAALPGPLPPKVPAQRIFTSPLRPSSQHVALCVKLIAAWFVPDVRQSVKNEVLKKKHQRLGEAGLPGPGVGPGPESRSTRDSGPRAQTWSGPRAGQEAKTQSCCHHHHPPQPWLCVCGRALRRPAYMWGSWEPLYVWGVCELHTCPWSVRPVPPVTAQAWYCLT